MYLTRRGREAVPVAQEAIAELEASWSALLGERDMNRLRRLLERLGASLPDPPRRAA